MMEVGDENTWFTECLHIKNRDELKYKLCNEHGIRVLFFCYYKKWVPEKYIDYVYTTIKELFSELDKIKLE